MRNGYQAAALGIGLLDQLLLDPPDPPGIPLLQAARQTAYLPARRANAFVVFSFSQNSSGHPSATLIRVFQSESSSCRANGHDDSDDVDRYRKQSADQQHDERQRREQYQQNDASDVFSGSHDESPASAQFHSLTLADPTVLVVLMSCPRQAQEVFWAHPASDQAGSR